MKGKRLFNSEKSRASKVDDIMAWFMILFFIFISVATLLEQLGYISFETR